MEVEKSEQERLSENGAVLVTRAMDAVITLPSEYEEGIAMVDIVKNFQKEVKKVWDPVCDSTNVAHKAATAGRKGQIDPFLQAEKILKGKLNRYDLNQQRLKREAEEKIRRDREEADRRAREEADKKLEEAEKLEAEGKTEEAEAVVEQAARQEKIAEAIPIARVETATPDGIRYQDKWYAEILDDQAVPRRFCIPDMKKLNQCAKDWEGKDAPAGVKFINDRTIIRRK